MVSTRHRSVFELLPYGELESMKPVLPSRKGKDCGDGTERIAKTVGNINPATVMTCAHRGCAQAVLRPPRRRNIIP